MRTIFLCCFVVSLFKIVLKVNKEKFSSCKFTDWSGVSHNDSAQFSPKRLKRKEFTLKQRLRAKNQKQKISTAHLYGYMSGLPVGSEYNPRSSVSSVQKSKSRVQRNVACWPMNLPSIPHVIPYDAYSVFQNNSNCSVSNEDMQERHCSFDARINCR